MTHSIHDLESFVKNDPTALIQLLVAAAEKSTYARILRCPTYPTASPTGDLPDALSCLRYILRESETHPAELFARLYEAAHSRDDRKRKGQFFTPMDVARFVLKTSPPEVDDVICDAGSGAGIFANALIYFDYEIAAYVGVENDPILALSAAHVLNALNAPSSYAIWYTSFLTLNKDDFVKFQLLPPTIIVANPPFIRFHNLRDRNRTLAKIGVTLGIEVSPLSGAGNYFLCKGAELLTMSQILRDSRGSNSTGGRMMFLMPKEAVGSAHYRQLRQSLQFKHGWHAREVKIPDRYLRSKSRSLALLFVFNQGDVALRKSPQDRRKRVSELPFGSILRVRRGISTGCNAFFVLTDNDVKKREIPKTYLRPVLPTKISLNTDQFTLNDWEALRADGHPCWLLKISANLKFEELELPVRTYLKEGIRKGLHATATAKRLQSWYSLPIPDDPPIIFVTYFFRGVPRFILNAARVVHLTNILGIRTNVTLSHANIDLLAVRVLNEDAKKWFKNGSPGREYRDGLRKIEPKELEKLTISDATVKYFSRHLGRTEYQVRSLFD